MMRLQMLAQHDKFLSSYVLPILHDKLRCCMTEKWCSLVYVHDKFESHARQA